MNSELKMVLTSKQSQIGGLKDMDMLHQHMDIIERFGWHSLKTNCIFIIILMMKNKKRCIFWVDHLLHRYQKKTNFIQLMYTWVAESEQLNYILILVNTRMNGLLNFKKQQAIWIFRNIINGGTSLNSLMKVKRIIIQWIVKCWTTTKTIISG